LKHDHIQLKDNFIELIKLQMDMDFKRATTAAQTNCKPIKRSVRI